MKDTRQGFSAAPRSAAAGGHKVSERLYEGELGAQTLLVVEGEG